MSIKKLIKIYIYCEGKTEHNYFQALNRNYVIKEYYVLELNSKYNDLNKAIENSEKLRKDKKY